MKTSRLIVRQWSKRPGRALATVASVATAVGAIVATWAAADASRAGYRRLSEAVGGAAVIDVLDRDGGRFAAGSVPRLSDLPGVRAVVPLLYRPTILRAGEKRVRQVVVGVDAEALTEAGLLALSSGSACLANDEVVLDEGLAASIGRGVGDEVLLFLQRRVRRMTVTGLAESRSLGQFAEGGGVVVDARALAGLAALGGSVDRVRVVLESGAAKARVLDGVRRRLPPALVAEVPVNAAGMAEDMVHSAHLGLDFVTGLTAAMAWFVVGNAMLMNVAERRRGFSLLRLLGATARMIRRLVAGEAAILGAVGAVAGAAVGLAAARPIAAGIARALDVPPAALAVDPLILPVAVAVGLALAVLAAWWPARAATRVDLLEGLARAPAPRPARISVRYAAAVVGLTAGAAGIQGLVIAGLLPPRFAVAGGIALLMAFIAATPLVLPPLARLLAMLVPGRWKTERTLALSQILRQPVRTALTTGVLVVAVTNAVGLGHAIRDSVDDVLAWFDRTMRADWVLIHAGAIARSQPEGAAVAGGAEAAVRALAAVAKLEGIGLAGGRVAGTACLVMARDMPDAEPLPVEPVAADPEAVRGSLARGEAVVGTALARRTGIAAGDEVVVDVLGRSTKLKVAALVVDYMSGGSSLLLRRDAAARLLGMEAADMLLVTATAGGAAGLREPLAAIAADHAMVLQSFVDFRRFVGRIVDGLVGALWTILGLGFVVGGLGVANTVTMNVLEQTRSLGLLRAVGMDGRHVTRMVVIQSLLLGAAGSLIGLVGGMTTAAFIQAASQPLLGHPLRFSFRPGIVAGTLAAAVAVTALAAWLPARRAARLDLLEAISTE